MNTKVDFLAHLKAAYPEKGFYSDPESGMIHWVTADTDCTDPFSMTDGRFRCTPDHHGLSTLAALEIMSHNLLCEEAEALR